MTTVRRLIATVVLTLAAVNPAWAVDSYRYLHVTIDTPWHIFIFLLFIVLSPFILMAILYWHFAGRKPESETTEQGEPEGSRRDEE